MERIERGIERAGNDEYTEKPPEIIERDLDSELDLRPEFCHYRDEGCKLSPSCLHCTLPVCADEQPGGRPRCTREWRNREINRLFSNRQKSIRELAALFNISTRTVRRALANGK